MKNFENTFTHALKTPKPANGMDINTLMFWGGYSYDDAEDAIVIADAKNGALLYYIPLCNEFAVEGETGEVISCLDLDEAKEQWNG